MSLQSRLLAAFVTVLATFVVSAFIVVSTQRSLLIKQVDDRLLTVNPSQISALYGTDALPQTNSSSPAGAVLQPPPIWDVYIASTDQAGDAVPIAVGALVTGEPDIQEAVLRANGEPRVVTIDALDGPTRYRALVLPRPDGTGSFVVAQPLDSVDAAMRRLTRTLWIAGGILTITLGLVWFWIQRLGLRPIARVTSVAESIAAGDRSSRVAVSGPHTEAGKLGLAFNLMLDERDAGETRLRQFVADASHELRTPLTSIRGYLDLVRQGAFRQDDQLDDVVRRLSSETARMNELVEDMLVLASLDEERPLRMSRVALGQLLADAAQDARAVQPARTITVESEAEGPYVDGDESLLIQLVSILVTNALTHTPSTAPLELITMLKGESVVLSVIDHGDGMAEAAAAHVFDRFWRGEASRSRSSGSTGLGLAIAHQIVKRHNGTLKLITSPGSGCTFQIALPRANHALSEPD